MDKTNQIVTFSELAEELRTTTRTLLRKIAKAKEKGTPLLNVIPKHLSREGREPYKFRREDVDNFIKGDCKNKKQCT